MKYFYIHGLNSGPQSRSGAALEKLLGQEVIRCACDYSLPFGDCYPRLSAFIEEAANGDEIALMGTSLGGFYALQLRMPGIAMITAWNPVIFPALQLAQFTGENTRFTDNVKWIFSREALLSYAAAPDPRVWQNPYWQNSGASADCPQRMIFLGDHDDLLDHEVSGAYWAGHAPILVINSGHSIEDFSHARYWLACGQPWR